MPKKKRGGGGEVEDDWENEVDEVDGAGTPAGDAGVEAGEGAKPPAVQETTVEDLDAEWASDDDKKKKKKKGKGGAKGNDDPSIAPEGGEEGTAGDGTVKTKAQKAAEKKQRDKEKKLAQKKKQNEGSSQPETPEATGMNEPEPTFDENDDSTTGTQSKKSKKKGGKDDKKEDKKPVRKGPGAAARKILEDQQRQREEDEKKAKEQKDKEMALLAAIQAEKDAVERKKAEQREKKKEKIRRQKLEGTFLTDKQKRDLRKKESQLAARGISLEGGDAGAEEIPTKKITKTLTLAQKKKERERLQALERAKKEENDRLKAPAVADKPAPEKVSVAEAKDSSSGDDWDDEDEEAVEEPKHVTVQKTENGLENDSKSGSTGEDDSKSTTDDDGNDEEEEVDESSDDEIIQPDDGKDNFFEIEDVADRLAERSKYWRKHSVQSDFRAPVVCVLGHVDTGKTKILDNLRRTNVQDGEEGGITQQIGATNVPLDTLQSRTEMVKQVAFGDTHEIKIPGLLIIDTPGHESFSNLRSRGSSLCDVAILVVDLMHGLEPQTRESIKLLKKNKTPFVVALNKIDRLYKWEAGPDMDVQDVLKKQKRSATDQFKDLFDKVFLEFAEEGLNVKQYWEFTEEDDPKDWVPVCPTSAHSGDGMGNLMAQLINVSQTICAKRITYTRDLKCTVMEVKTIDGLGKTVDAILVNGRIKNGDTVVLGGQNGPITTTIRQILIPPENKDLRVKQSWQKRSIVKGATGVKILGRGDEMDKSLAGLPLYVARQEDEVEYFKGLLETEIKVALKSIKTYSEGVYVQASTLGSLEALLEYLRSQKVKYANINIGPINRKDIMKASSMLDHNEKYGVVLGFDVPVTREAEEQANTFKPPIKIFTAKIIYHLTDMFDKYREDLKKRKQDEVKDVAIFPAKMQILPDCVFRKRDPIIVGVKITAGQLRVGAPVVVPSKENLLIGAVSSIEVNSNPVGSAKAGEEVCIKIDNTTGDAPRLIGRHFEIQDELVTKISRDGIDALKEWFRDDMTQQDWKLCVELKRTFAIL